jgi:uncharacterized cofD-like protein
MILSSGEVLKGEEEIYLSDRIDLGYQKIYLTPYPEVNPRAVEEIMNADVVVFGPGGLYTSLISSLLVDGVVKALNETKATKVFVVNLMNRKGQTSQFTTSDYLNEIERYTGRGVFDVVLVNNEIPDSERMKRYESEGDLVINDLKGCSSVIDRQLLGKRVLPKKGDLIKRNLIRHDMDKLAKEIMSIIEGELTTVGEGNGRDAICNK